MAFMITYLDPDEAPENVAADSYEQMGEWFEFTRSQASAEPGDFGVFKEQVLRIKAALVRRIDKT